MACEVLLTSSLYIVNERYWRDPYLFSSLQLSTTSKSESRYTVSCTRFPTPQNRVKVTQLSRPPE